MSSPDSAVPLSRVSRDLEAAEMQATEIAAGLSELQANWRPNEHSWGIVQCLAHLARTNRLYAFAMYEAVQAAAAQRAPIDLPASISPGWFSSWFIRSQEPPPRKRMKAPKKVLPASEPGDLREALAEFIASHEPIRGVLEASFRLDVNELRFKNPFVGFLRFTVGTGLLIINSHDRRHLWQAEQVKQAPGFPQG